MGVEREKRGSKKIKNDWDFNGGVVNEKGNLIVEISLGLKGHCCGFVAIQTPTKHSPNLYSSIGTTPFPFLTNSLYFFCTAAEEYLLPLAATMPSAIFCHFSTSNRSSISFFSCKRIGSY